MTAHSQGGGVVAPPNSVLLALERLGEASAREIADHLDRPVDSVKEQIRQMLGRDDPRIRDTGRLTAGALRETIYDRVGPAVKRPRESENGNRSASAPPGPERAVYTDGDMAARFRQHEQEIARLEQGLDAEPKAHAATTEKLDEALAVIEEGEEEIDALRLRVEAAGRQLAQTDEAHATLVAAQRAATDRADAAEAALEQAEQDRDEARVALARARADDVELKAMRQRYFDLLVGMAERDADEAVFDRIERMLDGGGVEA